MKDSTFESKAYGKRVNKLISIEGRVQFDLFQVHVIDNCNFHVCTSIGIISRFLGENSAL